MQEVSALYRELLARLDCRKEFKAVIAGEEYRCWDRIVSLETSGGLFEQESLCAGSAVSREAELVLRDPGTIPAGAQVKLYYRLTAGGQVSEWVQRGEFYVNTRESDLSAGTLTLHCFDKMLLADRPWEPDQSLEFPMPMPDAVRELCRLLGLTLDPRTVLNPAYTIDYPASNPDDPDPVNNNYTIRQIFRWIAAAHGGNWTITETGLLRLVRLRDLPPETSYLVTERGAAIVLGGVRLLIGPVSAAAGEGGADRTFVGRNAESAQAPLALDPITKIRILLDSSSYLEAGEDTGQTLEVSCPYGTQEMADTLLAELGGYVYQPLQAQDALIDPAVELGDGVTVAGVYALLAEMSTTFDGLMASDIGAPGQRETESELGTYVGTATRDMARQLATTRSLIEKSSKEVRLAIEETNGRVSELKVTLDGVTIQDESGSTRIKGSSIETESIAVGAIRADQVQLTGAISFGDLDSDAQGKINGAVSDANSAKSTVDGMTYSYGGRTYIDENMLRTSQVRASILQGGEVQLLDGSSSAVGKISITRTTNGYGIGISTDSGGIRISSAGNVFITTPNNEAFLQLSGSSINITGYFTTTLTPLDDTCYLGNGTHRWKAVYASNGTIQTSDARLKADIEDLPDKYLTMLDHLHARRYRMVEGTSGRYHTGFIAQEVEEAMEAAGIESTEFGGYVKYHDDDTGRDVYMLRYDEFIAPMLAKIQRLESRIKALEDLA